MSAGDPMRVLQSVICLGCRKNYFLGPPTKHATADFVCPECVYLLRAGGLAAASLFQKLSEAIRKALP